MNENRYTIIEDAIPVEDGGFKPGVSFYAYEVKLMRLKKNISIGTTLMNENTGGTFIVTLGKWNSYKLTEMKGIY